MLHNAIPVSEDTIEQYVYEQRGIVGLADGGGSNLQQVHDKGIPILLIGSSRDKDHPKSSVVERAEGFDVRSVHVNFAAYEKERGTRGEYLAALDPSSDMEDERREYVIEVRRDVCRLLSDELHKEMHRLGIPEDTPMFSAGFMQALSDEFVNEHYVDNIHPGDLRHPGRDGRPYLAGPSWEPSRKAIRAGHKMLYSTVHKMTAGLDAGPIRMRGYGLPIHQRYAMKIDDDKFMRQVAQYAQETLKLIGDYMAAGATFYDLFAGNWATHKETGAVAYRFQGHWYLVPQGIEMSDHVRNNYGTPFRMNLTALDETVTREFTAKVMTLVRDGQ